MTTSTERPQHEVALDRANHVRLTQAALRRELHNAPRPEAQEQLAKIIKSTDREEYLRARVDYLVSSPRRRGRKTADKLLRKLGIPPRERLGNLPQRQRDMLAHAITLPLGEVTTTSQHGFLRVAA